MPPTQQSRWNILLTAIILSLIFILTFYLQYSLLDRVKETVLDSMSDLSSKGINAGLIPLVLKSFGLVDWGVILGFGILLAAVIVLQVTRNAIGDFLGAILKSDKRTLFFLLFLGILFFKSILAPGNPYFMDAPSHVSRAWVSYLNFADGYAFPSWTNYYHNGFALFSHYGWLYYFLAGALNLLIHQIDLSCKIVTFALSLANVALFFVLGKALFKNRQAGFLLALVFVTANFFLYEVMWVGALFYPLVIMGALLLFLAVEKFLDKSWNVFVCVVVTALGANLLIHTHLGFAAQVLVFFAPWALLRMLLFYRERWKGFISYSLVSMAFGGVLAAFIFLPTFLDMGDVNFYKAFPFSDFNTYKFWLVPFWQFLVPRPFYTPFNYDYMGLALVAIAVAGLVISLKKPDRWFWFTLAMAVVTLFVIGYYRNNILAFFSVAFFAVAAMNRLLAAKDSRLVVVLFIVLLADGLAFNNFNTYDNRSSGLDLVFDHLEKQPDGTLFAASDSNTLHTGNKEDNNVFTSPWLKVVGHRLLQPNAIMLEANKQALYQYAVTSDLLVSDIQSGKLGDPTLQALNLMGVKYLLFHNSENYFVPPIENRSSVIVKKDGPWLELESTRALIWAPAVVAWQDLKEARSLEAQRTVFEKDDVSHNNAPFHYREKTGDYLHALVALENPSLTTPTADQFVLRKGKSEVLSQPGPVNLEVKTFKLDSQSLKLEFSLDKPGFVALPFAWFSYQSVLLDGKPVESSPTAFNTLCVKVAQPGSHQLSVGPSLSKARLWGAWISGLGLVVLLGGLLIVLLRRRSFRTVH